MENMTTKFVTKIVIKNMVHARTIENMLTKEKKMTENVTKIFEDEMWQKSFSKVGQRMPAWKKCLIIQIGIKMWRKQLW